MKNQSELFRAPPLWAAILFPSLAAGMGWGIRGQYGHETGAMIAGVLASLTLVLLFIPRYQSLLGARAAALMAVGIAVGGSMTYGQTIGLTQNKELIGNWEAWRWGMLGLAIKGGLWIGIGGLFLGMGLSGKQYRFWEMLLVMFAALGLAYLGMKQINAPFDPANQILPRVYFSEQWYFRPDGALKPRPEVWGGVLLAWLGLTSYARVVRGDVLALRLALWACLGGAIGFPAGQCFQSYHAWNSAALVDSSWVWLYDNLNWWNVMETVFGFTWGGILGLGLWLNRRLIFAVGTAQHVTLRPSVEVALCSLHLFLLILAEALPSDQPLGIYLEVGLIMITLPVACCVCGRFWPYLLLLPVSATPIIQKSLNAFCYNSDKLSLTEGWLLLAILPIAVLLYAVVELIRGGFSGQKVRTFAAVGLLLMTWLFFGLNTVFFDFAWPWREDWTGRTPNQVYYMFATAMLTCLSLYMLLTSSDPMDDIAETE